MRGYTRRMNAFLEARKRLNITQRAMADALGVSRSAISMYETGQRAPEMPQAWKLLDLCRAHRVRMTLEDVYPRPVDAQQPTTEIAQ